MGLWQVYWMVSMSCFMMMMDAFSFSYVVRMTFLLNVVPRLSFCFFVLLMLLLVGFP